MVTPQAPVAHDITFWYDPISPYAYLAFEALPTALMGLSVRVRYRPVLFAALLKAHGQLGPAEIPGKREWTYRQVAWLAHRQGVALDLPAAHPFNPLPLLRLALAAAADPLSGETNRHVTGLVFRHVWQGGGDPVAPGRLAELERLLQAQMAERGRDWPGADAEMVKQQLRRNTDEALAQGVFGVPTCTVSGRHFWGQDALPMLRAFLDGDAWFDGDGWHAPAALPAAVARR